MKVVMFLSMQMVSIQMVCSNGHQNLGARLLGCVSLHPCLLLLAPFAFAWNTSCRHTFLHNATYAWFMVHMSAL